MVHPILRSLCRSRLASGSRFARASRRWTLAGLAVAFGLVPAGGSAQLPPGSTGMAPQTAAPHGRMTAIESFTSQTPTHRPAYGPMPGPMSSPYGIQPVSYAPGPSLASSPGPMQAPPLPGGQTVRPQYPNRMAAKLGLHNSLYGAAPCPQPAPDACPPSYERLPQKPTFGDPDRPSLFPKGFLHGAQLRFDYLNYHFDSPGNQLIGAEQIIGDPREPFAVATTGAGADPVFVSDTSGFGLDNNNGVRATLVLPARYGDFEASVWGFEQNGNSLTEQTRSLIFEDDVSTANPGISLQVNGNPTNDQATVFNSQTVSLKTEVNGARLDYALKPFGPESNILKVRPVMGFQYLRYREQFGVRGTFTDTIAIVDDPLTLNVNEAMESGFGTRSFTIPRTIDAKIENHLFAPTLALRFEAGNDWLTFSAEPKLALAANRRRQKISTTNILVFDEITDESPGTSSRSASEETDLEPYFELNVAAKLRLTDRLSIHGGYNVLALTGIGRPTSAIEYDTIGGQTANINLRDQQDDIVLDGIFIGGEILLGPMPAGR